MHLPVRLGGTGMLWAKAGGENVDSSDAWTNQGEAKKFDFWKVSVSPAAC
jgi:hypothetical protein